MGMGKLSPLGGFGTGSTYAISRFSNPTLDPARRHPYPDWMAARQPNPPPSRPQERERTAEPSSAEAYVGLGQLHAKRGRKDRAIAMFREALRWKPDHEEAHNGLKELGAS